MKKLLLVAVTLMLLVGMLPVAAQGDDALVIWADDTRAPILTEVGEAFTEEFGVDVVVQEMGFGDIRDGLRISGPAGEGPDIIIGAHDWLGELVSNGLVAPMDLSSVEDLFLPGAIQAFNYEGEIYGMPYSTENVAFVYNPELIMDPPTTWQEVMDTAAELEMAGEVEYGYVIQTNDPYHTMPLMTAYGGYIFGRDDVGAYNPNDVGLDSEGAIEAFGWLEMMAAEGHIPTDVDYDVMHTLFETGDAAMIVTGPWALPRIRESGIPYAVTTLPSANQAASPFFGVQGFMISAFSENALLAEIFLLDYVATADVMQDIYDADPRPSAFLEVRDAIEDPDIAGFAAAGETGAAMPAIPAMGSVWTAWGNAQELTIRQTETAESALTTAAAQVRELIANPLVGVIALPGSFNAAVGCDSDWAPACPFIRLEDMGDGTWTITLDIPAGEYFFKVAYDGSWDENYGVDGVAGGDDIPLTLEADSTVTFVYDSETHLVEVTIE